MGLLLGRVTRLSFEHVKRKVSTTLRYHVFIHNTQLIRAWQAHTPLFETEEAGAQKSAEGDSQNRIQETLQQLDCQQESTHMHSM